MPREGILVPNPYERMTKEQVELIHHASMQILNDPGMLSFNSDAAVLFQANGAQVTSVPDDNRPCWLIRIPEELVLHAIESAPKIIKLGARNKDNSLILNGEEPRVFFVSGSETNIWLDVTFEPYVKKSAPSIEIQMPEFHPRRGTVLV